MLGNNSLQNTIIMEKQKTSCKDCHKQKPKISKNRCNASRCNKKITLIGQICPYCNIVFCLSHCSIEGHQCPNAHNCREQARYTNSTNLMKKGTNFPKLDKI
jgi:predicted nucleic acid binding AN1-type Zn finger protein